MLMKNKARRLTQFIPEIIFKLYNQGSRALVKIQAYGSMEQNSTEINPQISLTDLYSGTSNN